MSASNLQGLDQLKVDTSDLYVEEVITDLKVATIRRLTPIKTDGTKDTSRECIFSASTNVMTPAGAIPVSAEIDAKTLPEALQKFPQAVKKAVQEMVAEIDEMRRQQQSRIVVPQAGQLGAAGLGGPPPGGGRIKLT